MKLEVIAFDIESCINIQQSGAHRIELCDNPMEGGTTPSYGFIKAAREKVSINLFPIIRPRGGDFLYSKEEVEIMKDDIRKCKELGCDGVVIGLLKADGSIDTDLTKTLVEIAMPMQVTFHRAFDRAKDWEQALENVITCGCSRILTSGMQPNVIKGMERLRNLVVKANGRITIMPGSGVRSDNIQKLIQETGATEYHTSARKQMDSKMLFQNPDMNEDLKYFGADMEEVKKMLSFIS